MREMGYTTDKILVDCEYTCKKLGFNKDHICNYKNEIKNKINLDVKNYKILLENYEEQYNENDDEISIAEVSANEK